MQPLLNRHHAAFHGPLWQEGGQGRTTCHIGILIGLDILTGSAGLVNHLERSFNFTPVFFTGGLRMTQLNSNPGLFANRESFFDSLKQGLAFSPDMGKKNRRTAFRPSQGRLVPGSGYNYRVQKSARSKNREDPGLERFGHQFLHCRQFIFSWRPLLITHRGNADRAVSDLQGYISGQARFVEPCI